MLGVAGNCIAISEACEACYVPCAHSDEMRQLYTQQAGSIGAVRSVIDAFLSQQEEFLQVMCESRPALKGLAETAGILRCVPVMNATGSATVCGESKSAYIADCSTCEEITFDGAFYIAVIKIAREVLKPTSDDIRYFFGSLGWDVTYTPEFIYIDASGDDPRKVQAVLHLAPRPLGVEFRVVG